MIKRKKVNFHLIYCFIIGLLLGYLIQPKNKPQQNNKIEIKMHIIKDSVIYDTIVKKFTAKLPLTEKNLKKVLKENNINHSNVVLKYVNLKVIYSDCVKVTTIEVISIGLNLLKIINV